MSNWSLVWRKERPCLKFRHIVPRFCLSSTGCPKGRHILCLWQCCSVFENSAALEVATENQRKIIINSLSHTFISISISSASLKHTHNNEQEKSGGPMSPGKERGSERRSSTKRCRFTACGPWGWREGPRGAPTADAGPGSPVGCVCSESVWSLKGILGYVCHWVSSP